MNCYFGKKWRSIYQQTVATDKTPHGHDIEKLHKSILKNVQNTSNLLYLQNLQL